MNLKKYSNGQSAEFIRRAERAMQRASDKAMEDYKRFGIEPVIAPFRKKGETPKSIKK